MFEQLAPISAVCYTDNVTIFIGDQAVSDNKSPGPTGNPSHDKAIAEIWALFKESEARQKREADARKKEEVARQKREADARKKEEAARKKEEAARQKREADARKKEEAARKKEEAARKKEDDARQAKADARQIEVDRQIAKMSKSIKKLTRKLSKEEGQWGRIAESLVGGELIAIMKERFGVVLDDVALRMKGTYNDRTWEIDVIGVNSNVVVIVEVKTTLDTSHIKEFMRSIVNRFPKLVKRHKNSTVYAGIAYVRTSSSEAKTINDAEKNGLFVIKVINNTNKIVNSTDFKLHDHLYQR